MPNDDILQDPFITAVQNENHNFHSQFFELFCKKQSVSLLFLILEVSRVIQC